MNSFVFFYIKFGDFLFLFVHEPVMIEGSLALWRYTDRMAINKAMMAALEALSSVEMDVKKTYLAKRRLGNMRSKLYLRSPLFNTYDQKIVLGDQVIPVRIFRPRRTASTPEGIMFFFRFLREVDC